MDPVLTTMIAAIDWDGGLINDHNAVPGQPPQFEYPKGILALVNAFVYSIGAKSPVVVLFLQGGNVWQSVNRVALDEHGDVHLTKESLGTVRGIEINSILDVEEFVLNQMPFAEFIQAVAYDATQNKQPV